MLPSAFRSRRTARCCAWRLDHDEVLVLARGHVVEHLVVADAGIASHRGDEQRQVILPTAHGVELLLLHQSMPVMELVDLIAFAVRKERSVSRQAPPLNVAFCWGAAVAGGRDDFTISVTTEPLFFRCFRGSIVAVDPGLSISLAPAARTIRKALSSGNGDAGVPSLIAWSIAMEISRFIRADCAA